MSDQVGKAARLGAAFENWERAADALDAAQNEMLKLARRIALLAEAEELADAHYRQLEAEP